MTDTTLENMATQARKEHADALARVDALRSERKRLNTAIKEAVTRAAYLQRVVNATNPKPRTTKKASENGESQ